MRYLLAGSVSNEMQVREASSSTDLYGWEFKYSRNVFVHTYAARYGAKTRHKMTDEVQVEYNVHSFKGIRRFL